MAELLKDTLAQMDLLAGSSGRSVQALEAGWPEVGPVAWHDAYVAAQERAGLPAFDQTDGRTVAFLEGMQAALRMTA